MSVWTSPRYIDDQWQRLAKFVTPDFACTTLAKIFLNKNTKGSENQKFNIPKGNLAIHLANDKKKKLYHEIRRPGRVRVCIAVQNTITEMKEIQSGLSGIYKICGRAEKMYNDLEKCIKMPIGQIEKTMELGAAAAQMGRNPVKYCNVLCRRALEKHMLPAHDFIHGLIRASAYKMKNIVRAHQRGNGKLFTKRFRIGNRNREVHFMQFGIIVNFGGTLGYCYLDDRDITDMKSILIGRATYLFAFATYGRPTADMKSVPKLVEKSRAMVDLLDKSMRKGVAYNEVVRAFDVAYFVKLAKITADFSDLAYKEQMRKWEKEKLDRIFRLREYMAIADKVKHAEQRDLCAIHRFLPPPEYDYFSHITAQEKLYANNKPPPEKDKKTIDKLLLIYEYFLFKAFKKKHGYWPGMPLNSVANEERYAAWPKHFRGEFKPETVLEIDAKGAFDFATHDTDYFDLLKDKAVIPEDVNENTTATEYANSNRLKRSQVLDMLGKETPYRMAANYANFENEYMETRVDDKAEAKKLGGRLFFIMGSIVRLFISEYEANVDNYAREIPQIFIGKTSNEKIAEMHWITQFPTVTTGNQCFFVSFDLSKWSPRITLDVHKGIDAIWARLFDKPHINQMSKPLEEGKIHYFKKGIHHVMDKPGRDFEGIFGKKLTIWHLCVMYNAIKEIQTRFSDILPARFGVFIDDGVLRIERKGLWKDEEVREVIQMLDDAYKKAGHVISWDKTFIHDKWSVFLNEERYFGTVLPNSFRSLVKLNDRCEKPCPTFLDKLAFLDGRTSGAIKAGSYIQPAYYLYLYHVYDLLRSYRLDIRIGSIPLWLYTPVAFGGIGIRSPFSISGSVSGRAVQDGLANLQRIAYRYRALAPSINRILNVPMAKVGKDRAFRSPWAIRREAPCLKLNRLEVQIERKLSKQKLLPGLNQFFSEIGSNTFVSQSQPTLLGNKVSLMTNALIYSTSKTSVYSMVAAKLLKGSTALAILGKRTFVGMRFADIANFESVTNSW
mmetsp:Transcript_13261/g.25925  ORF Transcript_13261/g.25925 Transcript_13261/m.25925 type:complete len:1006 (+) Transcript_13261:45-3062(+)